MPELALFFVSGCVCSYLASLVFTYLQFSIYTNKFYKQINLNLNTVGYRYSEVESKVLMTNENSSEKHEIRRARVTYFFLAFVVTVLSWVGLFILITVWVSLKKLIKNRLWQELLSSQLAQKTLSEAEVRLEIEHIKSLGFDSGFE